MSHLLPPLPYAASALEPHILTRTMTVHHDKHHASYVNALNSALQSAPELLKQNTAEWLLRNLDQVPEAIRTTVRNNAGGHLNHSMLWQVMCPDGSSDPQGLLARNIDESFGNFEAFKARFEEAGKKLFGSGWVWLATDPEENNKLKVLTTSGHDNPLMQGYVPLLVNDVWEHAYYLKHENRRAEYLKNWWSIVNWREVEKRLEIALQTSELPHNITNRADLQSTG